MSWRHLHFVGIGGAGLSALAAIMLARGEVVSGSDLDRNQAVRELADKGATIYLGHAPEHVTGADLVVVTSAAQPDNPELVAARERGIPIRDRREFLGEVTEGYETIAIAGSHGKTTTTALIALMLTAAGLDPTVVVGGMIPEWNGNARAGGSRWFVIEADEYGFAFLGLAPRIAVLTNVDYDHPDQFPTPQAYQDAFADFLARVRPGGSVIVCGDEPVARELAQTSGRMVVDYGMGETNQWRAEEIQTLPGGGSRFLVRNGAERLGTVELQLAGTHNVLNALAALAAAARAGVRFDAAKGAVAGFRGVGRRLEVRGTYRGAILIDDYAHHPTEIRATLRAARERYPGKRIWAVFQPHTFSRTRALLPAFASAFGDADQLLVTEIYGARERDASGLSASELVRQVREPRAEFLPSLAAVSEYLRTRIGDGDVVLVLGAGDVNQVIQQLLTDDA